MGGLPPDLWQSVWLTIELAAITTVILLVVATPLAWWLARSNAWWTEAIATVIALPLVLPPTVLGFYLLVTLGPNGPGGLIASLWGGRTLAFTFEGLVVGSVLYSMPFVVQPIRNAFAAIGDLWVMPVSGSPKRLTHDVFVETDPAWSPSGPACSSARS